MAGDEPDRRTQRSKELLIHALLALIEQKHYDRITVRDIVQHANVGRSTFYAHFHDKHELLMGGFALFLDSLVQGMGMRDDGILEFDTTMLFRHAQGHQAVYRTLIRGSGFELLIKNGHAAFSQKVESRLRELLANRPSPSIALPLIANTLSGSLLVMLKWWLERKMPCSPEGMNAAFQNLILRGIRLALAEPSTLSEKNERQGFNPGRMAVV